MEEQSSQGEMSDEEALEKIAAAMKDNAPSQDEKVNVHSFLRDVVISKDTTRLGNLRDDKNLNEVGLPEHTLRGSKELELISRDIMGNNYFADFFAKESQITTDTSLSREGFLIRQATVQTKAVADVTKRRKINKGMFGKEKIEEQGGDPYGSSTN